MYNRMMEVIPGVIQFNKRLKFLREDSGLSQSELAKLIQISKSSINMYERGEREPKFETLEIIADYFNVDMDYLLGKSDIRNRYQQEMLPQQKSSQHNQFHNIFADIKCQLGADPHEAVSMYVQLDQGDQGEIRGEMKQMLKADKYKDAPCSKGDPAQAV